MSPHTTRGQSTVEYAVLIAVLVAALLAMQIYMKRGMQGRLRSATDDIGEQYVPTATTSNYTVTSHSKRNEQLETTGETTSSLIDDERQIRFGNETITTSGQTQLFEEQQPAAGGGG